MQTEIGNGLTGADVVRLRNQFGFNELPVTHQNAVRLYLKNFWGPLPWLMEALIVINLFSGDGPEAAIIVALLLINSGISTVQRRSTESALAALSEHLTVYARVLRDGRWRGIPARELLPGDVIRVRGGDVVPADALVAAGAVSADLSSLTGESLPKEIGVGAKIFSGSVVKRGEATAQVRATGAKTMYGETTELLEASHPPTHMERVIFAVIRFFFFWNLAIAVAIVLFGLRVHAAPADIINFVIVLLLTSVPISFPTMFAVAQSFGALQLARIPADGALVRRLAAVQDCATVDVLCSDKTGTLTMNALEVMQLSCYGAHSGAHVLSLAVACGDEADRDSIDEAIFEAAREHAAPVLVRTNFVPFNSQTKRTEADVRMPDGDAHVLMGLPELLLSSDVRSSAEARKDLARMSGEGLRVLAVLVARGTDRQCAGLIGLADPIRPEAPRMLAELRELGLRVVMITGDGRATAQAIATQLGLAGAIATPADLHADPSTATRVSVFAETYPADKLAIIETLQRAGHAVAMTGDGVNDAPALHQAEVGIAVSGATDVAKQSASFILTDDGLEGVVSAVKMSRQVYCRLRTWIINKIVKSFEVSSFTAVLFVVTHSYIYSPLLAVLLIFANDFVTISIATDTAQPTPAPGRWRVTHLAAGAIILALAPWLALAAVYLVAHDAGYSIDQIRTVVYLTLVWCGIGTLYALRSWPHAWDTRPSYTFVLATTFSFFFALGIAFFGLFTPSIPIWMIACVAVAAVDCFFLTDALKSTALVKRLVIAETPPQAAR